jgi:hypothetical protein
VCSIYGPYKVEAALTFSTRVDYVERRGLGAAWLPLASHASLQERERKKHDATEASRLLPAAKHRSRKGKEKKN